MNRKIVLATIGVLLLLGAAWFFMPKSPGLVVQAMGCPDIVKGCSGGGLGVRMSHVPQVMKPFRLEISAPQADSVEASFSMAGMEMGFNRYRLIKQEGQRWDADITLPVCVRGRKDWLLLLDIKEYGARRQVAIAFTTD